MNEALTPYALAELQDHLLTASNDLGRLETLLDDACRTLMTHFHRAAEQVGRLATDDPAVRDRIAAQIGGAVTALQFQDMAGQLVVHTRQRLDHCADRLAEAAFGGDEEGEALVHAAPLRANPVTQAEMDAGSVELF